MNNLDESSTTNMSSNNARDEISSRKRKTAANGLDFHHQKTPSSRIFSSPSPVDLASVGAEEGHDDRNFLSLGLGGGHGLSRRFSLLQESPLQPSPPPPPRSSQSISFLHEPLLLSPPTHHFYSPLLQPPPPPPMTAPVALPPLLPLPVSTQTLNNPVPSRPIRSRRAPSQAPREGKSNTVPPPYAWATDQRATIHSLDYLLSKEIFTITGDVQCKRCERQYELEFDLKAKFVEVGTFIASNKSTMHDRAPAVWMNPALPTCKFCDQENSVKPVIADKKKSINWLFLLLGQMLGCCTLEQLKYFCKHTKNHRTGAKDRVLYLTYLCLCKQLDPKGPFDR